MDATEVRGGTRRFRRWTRWTVTEASECFACGATVEPGVVYTRSAPRQSWCVPCTDQVRGVTTVDLDRFGDPTRFLSDLAVLDRVIAAQGWCSLPSDTQRRLRAEPVAFTSTHAIAAAVGLLLPDVPWSSAEMTAALLTVFADTVAELTRGLDRYAATPWVEDAARAAHVAWALGAGAACHREFGPDRTEVTAGLTVAQLSWALDLAGPDDPPLPDLLAVGDPARVQAWWFWPPGSFDRADVPAPLADLAAFVHACDGEPAAGYDTARPSGSWPPGTEEALERCLAALDRFDRFVVDEALAELVGAAFDPDDRMATLAAFVDRCRPDPW